MQSSINKLFTIFLTICLCAILRPSHGLRILGLFPLQVRSHYVMCEELMKGLAAKGHQVDVYSHFPQKKTIPNFRDVSLQGSLPAISNNMSFDTATITWGPTLIKNWQRSVGDAVCALMGHPTLQKLLHNPPNDPAYDLIITEIGVVSCYIAWGRHMNLPVVAVVTPPLLDWLFTPFGNPISLAADPSVIAPYSPPMSFLERLHNFVTFYSVDLSYNYYVRDHDKYVEKYLGSGYPNTYDLLKDVSLALVNHDSALSGVRTFAPMVVPVGGLHVVDRNETLDKEVQNWLDGSKSGCIYVSFGSMARIELFPKHILSVFYAAFRNIAPVRVLMKIAEPALLPPGLPSNILTQSWLQQIPVLKHKNIKAFVTHGGLMGIQESIYFGVPMIGIPLSGDQFVNAELISKKEIAIKVNLNEIAEAKFTNNLDDILRNPLYRKNIDAMSKKFKDHPMSPLDTSIYWIEYIHRHGKDALRSPIVDMPWWQASLLDVYGFIIMSAVLVLYVFKKIINKSISLLTPKTNRKLKKN